MSGDRILVIGGNAAGMTAASRAKRLNPSLEVTVVEAGSRIAYSICGLPYYLSGRVSDLSDLQLFTPDSLMSERGIAAQLQSRAIEIMPSQRRVLVEKGSSGKCEALGYDRLLLATGYRPVIPDIEGLDLNGVFTASRLEDAEAMESYILERKPKRVVLIGGGYVGLEVLEAMVTRGLEVTLLDVAPHVLPSLDSNMSQLVTDEIVAHGVQVMTSRTVKRIEAKRDGRIDSVVLERGMLRIPTDMIFVDVGVLPSVELAMNSGIRLGSSGAIAVSDMLETNMPGVYAAGNCVETTHLVSGGSVCMPLGTVAVKQGRVAGENLAGCRTRFYGAVGTSVVKVFDIIAGRTGLTTKEALACGFSVVESTIQSRLRPEYYDGKAKATVKIIAERGSGRLLGVQVVGGPQSIVCIDTAATALCAGMTVMEASQLDLAYAPPVGILWNPFLIALNKLKY